MREDKKTLEKYNVKDVTFSTPSSFRMDFVPSLGEEKAVILPNFCSVSCLVGFLGDILKIIKRKRNAAATFDV
jgi:hypothetical protein